jgi:hypothetical protein
MALGRNVGRLMVLREIGYAELARAIGLEDKQALWQLVKRDSKKSEFAHKLANYFGVSSESLASDNFDPSQTRRVEVPVKPSTDAEKLLVLVKAFFDTDEEGRNELVKIATAVAEESEAPGGSATNHRQRGSKRR